MSLGACELAQRHCEPCHGGTPPMSEDERSRCLAAVPAWRLDGDAITRTVTFKNYHQTMAFVNASAWISHREGHHPDLLVSYQQCVVRYTTHAAGGLTANDFICATKLDALLHD